MNDYKITPRDVWDEMKLNPAELGRAVLFDSYGWASNFVPPLEAADPLTGLGQSAYIFFRYGKDLGGWRLPLTVASYIEEATPFLSDWVPITTLSYGLATYRRMKKERKGEKPIAIK